MARRTSSTRQGTMWRTILPILAVFAVAVYYFVFAWQISGNAQIGTAGWIAMVLGVVFTLGLTAVLVTLLLRRGPDEE